MNIAATSGAGTGELLDFIASHVENEPEENIENELPHLAIVGRPNVGKSSLLNALTGEERNIVTPIAGTTRDTIHKRYNQFGFDFVLVDTAGIRKKTKVKEDLEFYSVMRSIRAIEDCDVVMLMIDASLGFESQDRNIFHLAQKNHKGIVILVNKWDLLEKDNHTVKQYEQTIRKEIEPFTDVPIVFISALTKQRIHKALETALQVHESRRRKIPARQLNDELLPLIENQPPPAWKGKYVRIKFITQLPTRTPQFAFFCNLPQYVREPYKRFLENQIRERWDFSGVPLEIYMRKK
jgi:GTP-binding protein